MMSSSYPTSLFVPIILFVPSGPKAPRDLFDMKYRPMGVYR